jgi:nucleoside-diphosphate-sugar epimerase
MSGEPVLVTGGTGFIATHCIVQLLDAGYRVRTTVRSAARADDVRTAVRAGADPANIERLEFVEADLLRDEGWPRAVDGAEFVLHVASPFPQREPKDADELIVPAREGALRVLRAARDAGARRVVLTSSFAAIGYGHSPGRPYTEADWTDLGADTDLPAYTRSKTLAERAAWEFMEREGGALELAVVNPVAVFGPPLGPDLSSSVAMLLALLNGEAPGVPKGTTMAVDVRDVATLHLLAMTHPDAARERFLAVAGAPISFLELATLLRDRLGDAARRVPAREFPDWAVRVAALLKPEMRGAAALLGPSRVASSDKAERMLGWQPRDRDEAIVASAQGLVDLGLVRS